MKIERVVATVVGSEAGVDVVIEIDFVGLEELVGQTELGVETDFEAVELEVSVAVVTAVFQMMTAPLAFPTAITCQHSYYMKLITADKASKLELFQIARNLLCFHQLYYCSSI